MYKYYSLIRPISIGTIPDCTIREVVNFNQRQYVEEIMRQAWGYFLTPDEIPEEKLQAYSLVSADAAVSKWQPVAEKISEFSKKAGDDMEPEDILSAVTSGNLEEITGYLVGFSRSEYKKEALVLFREVNSLRSYSRTSISTGSSQRSRRWFWKRSHPRISSMSSSGYGKHW